MRKKTRLCILHILFPLLAGAFMYYLIAPEAIFVQRVDAVFSRRIFLEPAITDSWLIQLFRCYLMDALWGYALFFALYLIMDNNTADYARIFYITFLFSTALELLQLLPQIPGTFDVWDIIVEAVAEIFAAFIINKHYMRRQLKYEKEI